MALKKEKEIRATGFLAEYQTILGVEVRKIEGGKGVKQFRVHIGIYKDKQSRDEGKLPIDNLVVTIDSQAIVDALVGQIYNEIKNLPEFEGAIDV